MTVRAVCQSDTNPLDDLLGESIIVRTVTHYYTGRLAGYDEHWLILDDAAWIADTGRWSTALATGKLNEIEPYPNKTFVATGAVVDLSAWAHDLPRTVK